MSQQEFLKIEEIDCNIKMLEQNVQQLVDICNKLQSYKDDQLKDRKCIKCEEKATKYIHSICSYVCDEYPLCQCKQLNIIKNEIYNN